MTSLTEQEQRIGTQLRAFRDARRLSVRTLASRAGFSPSFISQVEHGQASPSIASLERIATALGVSLGDFFLPDSTSPTVIRAEAHADFSSEWSRAQITMLGSGNPEGVLEPMMLTLDPGGRSGSRPVRHAGEEFAFIFSGDVELTLAETDHLLTRGDAITFDASLPHRWENVGADPAKIVIVSTRPPR